MRVGRQLRGFQSRIKSLIVLRCRLWWSFLQVAQLAVFTWLALWGKSKQPLKAALTCSLKHRYSSVMEKPCHPAFSFLCNHWWPTFHFAAALSVLVAHPLPTEMHCSDSSLSPSLSFSLSVCLYVRVSLSFTAVSNLINTLVKRL